MCVCVCVRINVYVYILMYMCIYVYFLKSQIMLQKMDALQSIHHIPTDRQPGGFDLSYQK